MKHGRGATARRRLLVAVAWGSWPPASLLSYLFGTVILASTINLVAGVAHG